MVPRKPLREGYIILKVCTLCRRVQRYHRGDRLPHWGDLTYDERCELHLLDVREHHTICPDCRTRIRERDDRIGQRVEG